jgi:hypothetical protein
MAVPNWIERAIHYRAAPGGNVVVRYRADECLRFFVFDSLLIVGTLPVRDVRPSVQASQDRKHPGSACQ